ncbi:BREX system P-loop protein BrxC [Candidatus Viadribacter manganicus]|uniref:BREX system P-loop protein BrxC n=1 Tax=Candidatus Viadribacter manganicus TaxID=1759059 RepID=A0A1B1AHP2_9PROT|nr:BREX system P-loop protein BrxC [Candidatus Viadribacter manganicus]ANP46082.1 hypothetical protein ATE48_09185 [Candidatus Viadribacter manganicus]
MSQIARLFASDIHRRIEEVIKVDQTDEDIIASEIDEYVVTDAIKGHFLEVLERYEETPRKAHEGAAVWVSGFFGSGKSSFAKLLGLSIQNREILGTPASERFSARVGDKKMGVVLNLIGEKIPTHTVIFDVSTDRGIRSGNQMLTEIMYRLFLESLGYSRDIDLAELEIGLEDQGKLDAFKAAFLARHSKPWDEQKRTPIFASNEASAVLHQLDPATYPLADSWARGRPKIDLHTGMFADRVVSLMSRRRPGQSLMFVADEVGQFIARDVQKMLDLQAIVQQLGVKGRGKHWVVVTSQERLTELVSGLDDRRVELARLMDRFPLQVHLEPSDIAEVTSRRVLAKNADAEKQLGKLFDSNRARLEVNTRLTADITLAPLTRQAFIDLYPLLPYQIGLVIDIVSGLRMQGGASRHVGGANRTIIKLAQQLLINPQTDIASKAVGTLVSIDRIYDLIEGNIDSQVRAKIATIPAKVSHPLAQSVAKAICLLQFVKTVHRTAENIAATLIDSVEGDSRLTEVREALLALEKAYLIRSDSGGYKIPTPAEDDWDQTRAAITLKPADEKRLIAGIIADFWRPQPSHTLGDAKNFRAGLTIAGNSEEVGDLTVHFELADDPAGLAATAEQARNRSQTDPAGVFWVAALDEDLRRDLIETFRSDEIIKQKSRGAQSAEETSLVAEEKARLSNHRRELTRRMRAAVLAGRAYFRGNERAPEPGVADVGKAVESVLGQALPLVYDRHTEASAKKTDVAKGIEALLTAENLAGLPAVFSQLALLKEQQGKKVFRTDANPLSEIAALIDSRASYGQIATGKTLEDQFLKAPFGWDVDVVRLLTLSLLRAGVIDGVVKGQPFDTATSDAARDCFSNNNLFRSSSFRPKKGIDFDVIVDAAARFKETFGEEAKELAQGPIAEEIRTAVERREEAVDSALATLRANKLPGAEMLETALSEMRSIRRGTQDAAILGFNASYLGIKEAIQRSGELSQALTEPALQAVHKAREALVRMPALSEEVDIDAAVLTSGATLDDLLKRETFFREFAAIEKNTLTVATEYARRYKAALDGRVEAYAGAVAHLHATPGWERLDEAQRTDIAAPLSHWADPTVNNQSIRHMRSETELAGHRLVAAIEKVHQILEGERLATVSVSQFFAGGIETEEQLDQALSGIREELARLIGAGKKVLVR